MRCINCNKQSGNFSDLPNQNDLKLCINCYFDCMIPYKSIQKKLAVPEALLLKLNIMKLEWHNRYYKYYWPDIEKYFGDVSDYTKIIAKCSEIKKILKDLIKKTTSDLILNDKYLKSLNIYDKIFLYAKSADSYSSANEIYIKYISPDLLHKRIYIQKKKIIDTLLESLFGKDHIFLLESEYYLELLTLSDIEKKQNNNLNFMATINKIESEYDILCNIIENRLMQQEIYKLIINTISYENNMHLIYKKYQNSFKKSNNKEKNDYDINIIKRDLMIMNRIICVYNLIIKISSNEYFITKLKKGNQNIILYNILFNTFCDPGILYYINSGQTEHLNTEQINLELEYPNTDKLTSIEKKIINTLYTLNKKIYREPFNVLYLDHNNIKKYGFLIYGNNELFRLLTSRSNKSYLCYYENDLQKSFNKKYYYLLCE
ncbi:hypothetical protein Hokovirus_4_60 [Hokovirus HKV1]|uniref:Uncharacterized protein n=1 Tax=Hokovirus HKV1 TaxID=1977638 RepID=A0A1V0SH74_9VIRU|nr:hypothetical protein Hokovirus_4_60 [Hokovirus HKV1]